MYVLGIDGGGTETIGVIANKRGEVVAESIVGASNPNLVTQVQLMQEFSRLIATLKKEDEDAFNLIENVFAGVSGTGHPSSRQKVIEVLKEVLPHAASIQLDNDAVIALYSETGGTPGIVQISGTGSITFGINARGKRARVGGWGHFVCEKGSGYGLGHDALRLAFAYHENMGPQTELKSRLLSHFKETELPNIIPPIYHAENPKEIIASLGKLVMEAADNGDMVAKEIIKENGWHIGKCITALIDQLFYEPGFKTKESIPIVMAGGLFQRFDLFQKAIAKELNNQSQPYTLIIPTNRPVYGAIIAALEEKE